LAGDDVGVLCRAIQARRRTAHALSMIGAESTQTRPSTPGTCSVIQREKPLQLVTQYFVIVVAPGIARDLADLRVVECACRADSS
jgi:hypothetical protein